jgi:hypothetical protein
MKHRIWTNGRELSEWRELHAITRNEYGDIVFELDGGELWQFTPGTGQALDIPPPERVHILGYGRDSKTGHVTGVICFLALKEPRQSYTGNLKVIKKTTAPPSEEKLMDAKAALREELDAHPLLRELTTKAEATQEDILREAVNLYKRLSPEKSAVLAAYMDKGSIRGAVKATGFAQGKVHKLLIEVEKEQGVEIIHRRRALEGEHVGDHYRQGGQLRNRTHRAG